MSTFDEQGGVEDMPPPQQEAREEFIFQVGDLVSPDDRGNQGVVIAVEPGRVTVQIVDKHTGNSAELFYQPASLRLVKRLSDARTLTVLTYADLQALPPSEWLIAGVMRKGELVAIYGPPGSGKSFVALDMALRIALGDSWAGHACAAGRVLYIAAEGLYSLRERSKAWVLQYQDVEQVEAELQGLFEIIGEGVSFIESEFELLLEALKGQTYVLIVVDTLARCTAGGDENNSKDMGLFIRSGDRLRKATGATVFVVHHSGKGDARIERGSSALRGACDAMFVTSQEKDRDKVFRVSCEKQKEGDLFADIEFGLKIVEVGTDEFGGPRMSGRLVFQGAATTKEAGAKGKKDTRDLAEVIQRTLAESFFEDGAAGTALRQAADIPNSTFHRELKELVDGGFIDRKGARGNWRYTLNPKSKLYKAPTPPPPEEPNPSPNPSESHDGSGSPKGNEDTSTVESQSQSPSPPLGGDGSGSGTDDGPAAAKKPKRRNKSPQQGKGGAA